MTKPLAIAGILCCLSASPAAGQWIHLPTPGIPRTADGKPNLTAPAPTTKDGTPDLTGIWQRDASRYYNNAAADLKPEEKQSWVEALYRQRKAEFGRNSMEVRCLPLGPAATTSPYSDFKFIQTPALIVVLVDDLTHRQIRMDGRQLPKDPNPAWMGYSVGRWDGDTLVVESNGFSERAWLDYDGHPHTEQLRITERYRRPDFGHLDLTVEFDDPGAYTKAWTVSVPMKLFPDTELLEHVCKENEKDFSHMPAQGAGPPAPVIKVSRDTLARYAGSYEIKKTDYVEDAVVSLSGDVLFLERDGGKQALDALSETTFSQSGDVIQFVLDGQGRVTHFLIQTVEGQERAERKP